MSMIKYDAFGNPIIDDIQNSHQLDAFGNPVYNTAKKPKYDAFGNPIIDDIQNSHQLDAFGNPLYNTAKKPKYDAFGNPIIDDIKNSHQLDTFGNLIYNTAKEPKYDAFGNPICKVEEPKHDELEHLISNEAHKVYVLNGNWKAGWALDLHTLSSYLNENHYDTKRTIIGESLFKLKYRDDRTQVPFLVDNLVEFLKTRLVMPYIDVILPTPSSKHRNYQPVYDIAYQVAQKFNKSFNPNFIYKVKETQELKSVFDINERRKILSGAFAVRNSRQYANKKILIIDDLFRSGSTLNEISSLLYNQANVQNVYVVTLTKTRVNK